MSKHTPGPWSVPHFATDCACNCAYVVSGNQHGMGAIATVHHSDEADGEHNEPMDVAIANARLIAAAPDMLEALRKMRELLRLLQPALNVMAREVMDDIIKDQIDPAIAAATGEV